MTASGSDLQPPRQQPGRRRRRASIWALFCLLLMVVLVGVAVLTLTGRSVAVPTWVVQSLEKRVNDGLRGKSSLRLGEVDVLVDADWVPRLRLQDVVIRNASGAPIITLPDLRLTLSKSALLERRIQPQTLRISGASLTLRRTETGAVQLDLGTPAGSADLTKPAAPGSLGEILDRIDQIFAVPELAGIERIDADGLTLTLDDARAGRVWRVTDGKMALTQTATTVGLTVEVSLPGVGKTITGSDAPGTAVAPAGMSLSFTSTKGARLAHLGVTLRDMSAGDIATQSPALAWLGVLDAPISGTFRADTDSNGDIGTLNGTLEIGAGALRPANVDEPIPINRGKVYFAYDPVARRIDFSEISIDSRVLRIQASAQAYLADIAAGMPQTLLGQVQFSDVAVDPAGLFQEPVRFSQGALDIRLRLDPFALTIGQLVLIEQGRRIEAKGEVGATAAGWDVSLDLLLDEIAHDRLLALWPVTLVAPTRAWLKDNVQTGQLFDVKAALRLHPHRPPRLSLGYEFTNTDVRFIKTLPPITQSTGYSTIEDSTFTLVVDKGIVTAPQGGAIDVAGTVFSVPDITVKPAPAKISLRTDSTITAALALLDEPPFRFLTKAGQPIDIAEGHARMVAEIDLTLAQKVLPGDVKYTVTGQLSEVVSDKIVPGRMVTADAMILNATQYGMEISGAGALDGLPFRAAFTQAFGPEAAGRSRVDGTVELSQRFLDTFRIGLPPGSLRGTGQGRITIDLLKGAQPSYELQSDLTQLALKIPAIGWAKSAAATGNLTVKGRLGTPPTVDLLTVEAPGLRADGTVTLNASGTLNKASFGQVRVGGWLDAPVVITGQGKSAVSVAVNGGTADLRKSAFGGNGSGPESGALSVSLDTLTISEGIALTNFSGKFSGRGGFNGSFSGLVNGEAPVTGVVAPSNGKTAVRLQSQDAGAVFKAAGVFDKGRGGVMDLTLIPSGVAGEYNGRVTVKDTRVRGAPVLAEMLGAISVIGLLEQLNGDGIVFNDVEADFRLTPKAVEVRHGSAVGGSMGVTMAGLYILGSKRMDMRGLISPIYLLNGIGSILTRKGEGLFGFDYHMAGTAAAPTVQVNPLSILTPGMFRELFRTPPSTLGTPDQ